jgi:5-formyltetrahydrofolate cyclo-ligase
MTDIPSDVPSDVPSDKDRLRKVYRARRRRAFDAGGAAAAERMTGNFHAKRNDMGLSGTVAVYAAMGSEIDAMPLSLALQNDGYDLALPVVASVRTPLIFRRWKPGDDLIDGPHATRHPGPEALQVTPGVVLAPLVAFDRKGCRLGQGQGYYDRTLKSLRAAGPVLAVGLAFAAQEADGLPEGDFDEPLDWLVTEKEVIKVRED